MTSKRERERAKRVPAYVLPSQLLAGDVITLGDGSSRVVSHVERMVQVPHDVYSVTWSDAQISLVRAQNALMRVYTTHVLPTPTPPTTSSEGASA